MISPLVAFQLLQVLPKFIGPLTGKEDDAKVLSSILALPGMAAGILGKSSSTGTSTTTGGTASEADSLTDMFKNPFSSDGLADSLQIGEPTQPGRFKPIKPMYGIGAGWGM